MRHLCMNSLPCENWGAPPPSVSEYSHVSPRHLYNLAVENTKSEHVDDMLLPVPGTEGKSCSQPGVPEHQFGT